MQFRPRWQTIDRRLPLLFAGILLVTVAALSWTAYRRLERVLLTTAGVRLQIVSRPIARSLAESAARRKAQLVALAGDSDVRAALTSETSRPAAVSALRASMLMPPIDSGGRLELREAGGRTLLSFSFRRDTFPSPWANDVIAHRALAAREAVVSPIEMVGDSLFLNLLVAVPSLRDSTAVGGYLLDHRPVVGRGVQDVRDLVGQRAVLLVGTPGGAWTDLTARAAPPPSSMVIGRPTIYRESAHGAGVGAATAIPGTPWVLWIAQPWATAFAPMRGFARNLAILAAVFLVLGSTAAWLLSRRITRPLVRLTTEAEAIAVDERAPAADPDRPGDEIERLTSAFEHMSRRVNESHMELEQRVRERTQELEAAVHQLHAAQDKLVLQERLAILGRLASAVGHELRNPLGVMTNAIYVLESVITDPPPIATEYIGIVRSQIALSERIVGDLLDTARTRPPQIEPVALDQLLDTQLQRLGPTHGITVQREYAPELPPASADPAQLTQIVLNLLTNAVQAMGEKGGTLTVATRANGGKRVRLEVRDTGPGISPEMQERIFEPLFTTKARGLGLGLWVSRTLAEANAAELRVESRPGPGSTFVLDLPATAPVAQGAT